MTPEQLRASILQYAIQGKLVEQRAEEGTGEELYRQVQAEKQRLGKEGKIKKEKPLPEITEDEISFNIPESWKWVRLGNICQLTDGEKIVNQIYVNLDAHYMRGNREGKTLDRGKYVRKGTQLILVDGENSGEVFTAPEDGYMGSTFKVLWIASSVYTNYILYFIALHRITLKHTKKGAAIPHLNKDVFFSLLLPLPPLAEQKRIVAKIEELLPLVDHYAASYEKLEQFNTKFPDDMKKSILQYAIQGKLVEQRPEEGTGEELYKQIQTEKQRLIKEGKIKKEKPLPEIEEDEIPFDIPESWKWVRLGTIGYTNIGLTYSPNDQTPDGIIVLRSNNIQNGKMVYDDIVRVNMKIPYNKMCQIGDILICARNGSKRLVGKSAIVDKAGMSFGAFMAIFRSICNPYMIYVINSAYFKNSLLGDVGTTTINQITQDVLKNSLVPLPPLAEQKRIVAKIEELLPLCEQLK